MWWCLIFDFTFSFFACFCCCCFVFSFLLSSSSCFRVFVLHIICVIRESFMFPLRMTHGQRITPFRFFFFFLSFFPVLCRFCCLAHANLNRDRHRVRMNISSNRIGCRSPSSVLPDWSPVGGNKANEGVARLSWMSVTNHREVSVWFEDLQIFRLSYLSLSLSHSFLVNEEIEWADIAKCWVSAVGLFPPQRWVKVELQKIVHCLFSWGHRKNKGEKENKIGKTKPI